MNNIYTDLAVECREIYNEDNDILFFFFHIMTHGCRNRAKYVYVLITFFILLFSKHFKLNVFTQSLLFLLEVLATYC